MATWMTHFRIADIFMNNRRESVILSIKSEFLAIAECKSGCLQTVGDVRYFSAE